MHLKTQFTQIWTKASRTGLGTLLPLASLMLSSASSLATPIQTAGAETTHLILRSPAEEQILQQYGSLIKLGQELDQLQAIPPDARTPAQSQRLRV